jgi:hypothetical protein
LMDEINDLQNLVRELSELPGEIRFVYGFG